MTGAGDCVEGYDCLVGCSRRLCVLGCTEMYHMGLEYVWRLYTRELMPQFNEE
jgi:hypothetical protein